MHNTTTIFMVDDHSLLRDALSKLINGFNNCSVIGLADNGQECINKISAGTIPDIVILDIRMPVLDGYDTALWLKQKQPQIKVLVLTMFDSEVTLIRLLKLGVKGFMKKDISTNEMQHAIATVVAQGYYYSNASSGRLAGFFNNNSQGKSPLDNYNLSDTDLEFLKFVATDLCYKEIALKLNMTPRNIDATRDKLFLKLDVKSRVGLAIFAVKAGIVAI